MELKGLRIKNKELSLKVIIKKDFGTGQADQGIRGCSGRVSEEDPPIQDRKFGG